MANLQEKLEREYGRQSISRLELPDYFETSLSPSRKLRPYQEECFRYFLTYMNPENDFDGKQARPHLLFHMATGSGKTLIMAGAMLYLYEQGYRNFLFFVDSTNIVEKTKDNFLNASSSKYLFAPQIVVDGKRVEIRKVENFQETSTDCINLCLYTIQGLHTDLNSEKENSVTYDDFTDQPVVLISDEAHHMNAWTKSGKKTKEENEHIQNWEQTIVNIFNKDNGTLPNILLEFTATVELTNPIIAQKYENKVIFDYDLKKFREDKYSKDVDVVESDLEPLDMALQAIILSQYKRKVFAEIQQDIKPVVLLKSKSIEDSKDIYSKFILAVANITENDIEKIRERAKDDVAKAFDYFDKHNISHTNLILELREDFAEERLLLVDSKSINPEKQQLLNSLEDANNGIRAIFAVDMLNEGWDVLNLYDIVRLYTTRVVKDGQPGRTTIQEAQLIGRGARYMPFSDPKNPTLDKDMRKYDGDAGNQLRVIETLHYHSTYNPRYIQELKKVLRDKGIIPDNRRQLKLFLKEDFKASRLYNKGLVFLNKRILKAEADDDGTIGNEIKGKTFSVSLHTGQMRTNRVFSEDGASYGIESKILPIKFKDIDSHIARAALNCFASYHFDSLKRLYPGLKSIHEFIASENYLANLSIKVNGTKNSIYDYSQKEKLQIAKTVLKEIEPLLISRGKSYRGTKEFVPCQFKDKFRESILLNVTTNPSSNKEFGISMRETTNPMYYLDLRNKKWYAYDDNFGTSEEKALVKYLDGIMENLEEKYNEIFLVRNEKDICIYDFDEGRRFEPDFVLFLRLKGTEDKYDNLQLFIEPKGDGLLKQDKWKNDFLKQIKSMADITYCTQNDDFQVWGIPFFNESTNMEFEAARNEEVLKYSVEQPATIVLLSSSDIPEEKRYKLYLPVYDLKAACGYFEENMTIPENETEGWIDISQSGIKVNKNMFVIYAAGDSMLPDIKDGDMCVFEFYGPENGGSREGKIVLTECRDKDTDTDCHYTIKKYHSTWHYDDEGNMIHDSVEFIPLNTDEYETKVYHSGDYKTIGIFKGVINK